MKNIKKTKKVFLAAALFIVLTFLLYDIFFGRMGLVEYRDLKAKYEDLEKKKENLSGKVEEMKKEVSDLRDNLEYIEEIARKDLGLVKDKEQIIIIEDDKDISEDRQDGM